MAGLLTRFDSQSRRFVRKIHACVAYVLVATMALAASATFAVSSQTSNGNNVALPQFLIVDYHPVSKTLVQGSSATKPLYDYAYRVDVRNSGSAAADVSASATTSKSNSIQVVQPGVHFGPVDALRTQTSSDTFTVRAYCHFDHRLDPQPTTGASFCSGKDTNDDLDMGGNGQGNADTTNKNYANSFANLFDWQIQVRVGSAPKVVSILPAGNINQARPTISASFLDTGGGVSASTVTLTVDGINVTPQVSVTVAGFSYVPSTPLNDGAHEVALTVSDLAGHASQVTWSFTTDTIAPTMTGMAPQNITTANPLVPIGTQYADVGVGINLSAVKFTVDGVDVTALSTESATSISYTPTAKLSNGDHVAALVVADAAGNVATVAWSFKIDQSGPKATDLQPVNSAILAADVIPVVSAKLSAGLAPINAGSVTITLDGTSITAQAQISATGVTYTPVVALSEGNHTVKLSVTDQYGNVSTTTWAFVTRTPPEITGVAPQDITLNAQASQVITAQFRDIGAGIDRTKTTLLLDGIDVTSQAQITDSGLTFLASSPLPQGVHIANLSVTDKASNSTEMTWRFTIYTGLPVISGLAPQDVLLATGMPTITANYQDSGDPTIAPGIDTASVKLTLDNVDVTAQSQVTASGIRYTPTQALSDGLHTVKLTITDKAANMVNASWSFVTDTGRPTVSSTFTPIDGAVMAADALPFISAQFQETVTGVDAANVRLELDGVDITVQAQVTAAGIAYTPAAPLAEGAHSVKVTVPNKVGTATVQTWTFTTATPPVITSQSPVNIFLPGGATPVISASYSDVGAGVDTRKTVLQFDGADITAQATVSATGIQYLVPSALVDGTHTIKLAIADKAGNLAESTWSFGTATPPTIGTLTPKDVTLPPDSKPTIAAQYVDTRVDIDAASVKLLVDGTDVTALSQVTAGGISYTPAATLASGPHTIYLEIANKTNATAQAVWGFDVDAVTTYNVTITSPAANATASQPRIDITAIADANRTYATGLTVNGKNMVPASVASATGSSLQYTGSVDLADGSNTITVTATYADGQTRNAATQVTYNAPPVITITSPTDKATLGPINPNSPRDLTGKVERPIVINGRTSKPVQSVTINQQAATLSGNGTEFSFTNFFLHEGINLLSAVATDANGKTASTSITVAVDQTAPLLSIEAPVKDAVTSSAKADVRGVVNDAIEGWIDVPYPTVTVTNAANNQTTAGKVADRFYIVEDVPLEIGGNTLTITATDHVGNSRSQQVNISRIAAGSNRLTLLSGNRQRGGLNAEVSKPLAFVALAKDGNPLANLPVTFDVLRGTGSLNTTAGGTPIGKAPARNLTVMTDDAGRAQVWLTLGKQSGEAGNMVRASHPTIGEDVVFTASGEKGLPAYIRADAGITQYGETSASALEALSAIVTDAEENRLPNAAVVFTIDEGDAAFTDANGNKSATINASTDKNGMAAVRPIFGTQAGLVRVTAKAINPVEVQGASYQINVLQQQDGPTRFSGKVLSHTGEPLPGVRVSIGRTSLSATADDSGYFTFDGQVPPGKLDLFIDGRTANVQTNQYPALHFEALAVRGQNNVLPHAIHLPPLLMSEAKIVGGDQDVTLKIPGFEGFEMVVKANSVTFPDGSKTGPLVVSPVQQDKLPMVPPGGYNGFMAPAWTIQPSGTRFDPPIQVKVPNSINLKPGETREIYQWDHDLATFVPMGRATVSEDGALLISDANSGLTKAGWGGSPNPPPDPPKCGTSSPACPDCQIRETSGGCKCVADIANTGKCDDKNACTFNDKCKGGTCKGDTVQLTIDWTTDDNFMINTDPRMPMIRVTAKPTGTSPTNQLRFNWKAEIEWKVPSRTFTTKLEPAYETTGGTEVTLPITSLRGGDLKVTATLISEDNTTLCTKVDRKEERRIQGQNPDVATVVATIRASAGELATKIACHESHAQQFGFMAAAGMPTIGIDPNPSSWGVGIMQVTDDRESPEIYWNWRTNVSAGAGKLAEKVADAAGWASRTRRRLNDPTIPNLSADQLELEAMQRYNGGAYWNWNVTNRTWIASPPNDYVRRVLNDARSICGIQ